MTAGMNSKETVIGLLLEDIESDFSKELVKSVAGAIPQGKGVRLAVLPGKHIDGTEPDWLRAYKTVYNSVFSLAKVCQIDGFIIHLGSISERDKQKSPMYRDDGTGFAQKPKVYVASDMRDCVTVNYDNESGIREAVEYLINVCGITRFCMLGGRDDNKDARARKAIFTCCLAEYGINFRDRNFIHTDMTIDCEAAAAKLLDSNPDVQAIFCVNDAVAKGLYAAMEKRGLTPGQDIQVFGFDNTKMSSELIPQLTSIGSDSITLGAKALELLLRKMDGENVRSATVPTRLYGRDSFPYEMYDYSVTEMVNIVPAFVYRMFDDCFYRYKNEKITREMVDLRRLFYEMITRMLTAMKRRYMSPETFTEISKMIDKFFEKGAMSYTDAGKLLRSIDRLQNSMNSVMRSMTGSVMINKLFLRMKDKAIVALANQDSLQKSEAQKASASMQAFIAATSAEASEQEDIYRSFDMLGIENSALYVYEKPIRFEKESVLNFPEHTLLRCVMRGGELYLPSKVRQRCTLGEVFSRSELSFRNGGLTAFPIFCGSCIYGILICSLSDDIYNTGEYVATQLGRSLQVLLNKKENTK